MLGIDRPQLTEAQEAANERSLVWVAANAAERAGDYRRAAELYARRAEMDEAAGLLATARHFIAYAEMMRERARAA